MCQYINKCLPIIRVAVEISNYFSTTLLRPLHNMYELNPNNTTDILRTSPKYDHADLKAASGYNGLITKHFFCNEIKV